MIGVVSVKYDTKIELLHKFTRKWTSSFEVESFTTCFSLPNTISKFKAWRYNRCILNSFLQIKCLNKFVFIHLHARLKPHNELNIPKTIRLPWND